MEIFMKVLGIHFYRCKTSNMLFVSIVLALVQVILAGDDIAALLSFKSHVDDPLATLRSWNTNTSVCEWNGVTCSAQGHVIGIYLHSLMAVSPRLLATQIQNLSQLRQLHISGSNFSDPIDNNVQIENCSLEVLDISGNQLYGGLPTQLLATCRGIKLLNLSHNQLDGKLGRPLINKSLERIDLSYNRFSDALPGAVFSTCTRLRYLDFSINHLSGQIPQSLVKNCIALEYISLAFNNLSGEFPSLDGSSTIQMLSLTSNSFNSLHISKCTTLTKLDASANRLSNEIFVAAESCSSLQVLNISGNSFSGSFFGTLVGQVVDFENFFPAIEIVDASFNHLTGEVPMISGSLKYVDFSSNGFTNTGKDICSNATSSRLESLILVNNRLTGEVLQSVKRCHNLKMLDMSFNSVSGGIPGSLCDYVPKLRYLLVSGNNLEGEIPASLAACRNLSMLLLNYNRLNGSIPPELSQLHKLWWFDLSSNELAGNIPSSLSALDNVELIQLNNNNLSGEIPAGLGNCSSLMNLELAANNLMGSIPARLGRSEAGVAKLNMGSDEDPNIVGDSVSLGNLKILQSLEPKCRGMASAFKVQGINLQDLRDVLRRVSGCKILRLGLLPSYAFNVTSLIKADVSYNMLSGSIPDLGIGDNMQSLLGLFASHNLLSGTIPATLGKIKGLQAIDLSYNALQGSIPASLSQLTLLNAFNVSNNNLSGMIPANGQLEAFPESSYAGNPGLCGSPLKSQCGSLSIPRSTSHDDGKSNISDIGFLLISLVLGIASFSLCSSLAFFSDRLKLYLKKQVMKYST